MRGHFTEGNGTFTANYSDALKEFGAGNRADILAITV